jgi:hypothetical protein
MSYILKKGDQEIKEPIFNLNMNDIVEIAQSFIDTCVINFETSNV